MTLSATATPARKPRRALRIVSRTVVILVAFSLLFLLSTALWLRHAMHAALPQIQGSIAVAGL
jgi:penicillin amidase